MASEPSVFALDVSKFVEKAKAAPTLVMRRVSADVGVRVVERSPVDTGRFRANWNVGLGRIDTRTSGDTDKGGEKTKARLRAQVDQYDGTQTSIVISNSLPYAIPLEYGWSKKQAPQGMVRITVTEFQTFVNAAVAELPK